MNGEKMKMKDNQLFNGSLLFFIIIAGGVMVSLINDRSKGYAVDNATVLTTVNGNGHIMSYLEFLEIYNPSHNPITFVDLRSEEQFRQGHLHNAMHLPMSELITKESLRKLKQTDGELILYSNAQHQSVRALMILRSLGLENIRALAGNYELLKEKILESPDPVLFFHDDEKARWNYRNFMNTYQTDIKEPSETPTAPNMEGGC